jgi:predicted outer membrane repeat protein
VLIALSTLLLAASSHGAVRHVPSQDRTIQAAVNAAANGDLILVAAGFYTGQGNRNIELLGKAITVRSESGPESTIIDAGGSQSAYAVAFNLHHGESNATVIEGFTIRGGYAFNGAGMHLQGSSPTIRNCVFTANQADCWGAGLYFDGNASPLIADCVFDSNISSDDGGAIFGLSGSPVITNTRMTNNVGTVTGGAITIFGGGTPKLINSTVVGNSAFFGAAIYSNNLQVTNSIIWGNTGGESQIYDGGGQWTLDVRHSLVQGGYAGAGNIDAAPTFVDAANGDFHLKSGSAGIDAGDPATVTPQGTLDLDGDPRSFGSAIDMGIDEFRRSGDADGDHVVDINDLLMVINTWGPCSWSTADFNGDFRVDIDDLLRVINGWGA